MLRSLATIDYYADEVSASRPWYARVLGVDAHFARPDRDDPDHVGFRVDDVGHELGVVDSRFAPQDTSAAQGGPITYREVDDLAGSVQRLDSLGARAHREPVEHGPASATAPVTGPFGKALGPMYDEDYRRVVRDKA